MVSNRFRFVVASLCVAVVASCATLNGGTDSSQSPASSFPQLAPLDGISNQALIDIGNIRRAQFEKLNEHQQQAERDLYERLGDFSVFRNAEALKAASAGIVDAARRRAQVDLERDTYAGSSRDNPTAAATQANVARRVDTVGAERRLLHAAVLSAAGDSAGSASLIEYWGMDEPSVSQMATFIKSDAAGQAVQLDALAKQLQADAASEPATLALIVIARNKIAASEEVAAQAFRLIEQSKSPLAAAFVKSRADRDKQLVTARTIGKPLVVAGKRPDGSEFSSESLKGKVILIDFWATWCGPCVAELPRLKGLYEKHHAEGFEIIGISNDHGREPLDKFLAANPDMKWPQLFDAAAAEAGNMHPVSQKLGVNMIPQYFVIDRKGVLRSVTARRDMETLIPQLLAEPAN